jgi:allantoinase
MSKPAYGPFPYSAIVRRPPWRWPNGARLALWIVPNIEFFSLAEKVPASAGGSGAEPPNVSEWSARDYGNRIGVFRLMKTMDRYGARGTVALNADLCVQHPEIIEEAKARGWEFMGHNESNTRRLDSASPGEENAIIHRTLAKIEQATGVRPRGWLSSGLSETWGTLGLLAENRVDYVCDWVNDDQPYEMSLENGRGLVSVPYSLEINDKPAFEKKNRTAEEFGDMIRRQFDVLWQEGEESARVMAIALHPYLTGAPHRIGALDAALAYICKHEAVWLATGGEIVDAYRAATSKS